MLALETLLQPWLPTNLKYWYPGVSGCFVLTMDADDDFDLDLKFISGLNQFNTTEVVH